MDPQCKLKVAITGASGLIGSSLSSLLSSLGYNVYKLVRRRSGLNWNEIFWNPDTSELDISALEGMDAVINLAGENIAKKRWSEARKESIKKSRVRGTKLISQCIASLKKPPKVFVSASAIGYYGNRIDEVVNECSVPGDGFLSQVCQEWEGATQAAQSAGTRVVIMRIGLVLSSKGGVLPKLLPVYKGGIAGKLGSGKQWISWISIKDLVRAINHFLISEHISGRVNVVSPGAVTNLEFTKILGKVLHTPTILTIPSWVVRMLFGEMGDELFLQGARVEPRKLSESGFLFNYPSLEAALLEELRDIK